MEVQAAHARNESRCAGTGQTLWKIKSGYMRPVMRTGIRTVAHLSTGGLGVWTLLPWSWRRLRRPGNLQCTGEEYELSDGLARDGSFYMLGINIV